MPYSVGANTKSTFEVGPEAHKLFLEFEVDGTIHVGQPVTLHADGNTVSPATAASLETDIVGISIHEGQSAYGDFVTIAMRGYAVIQAKATEVIVPGPIIYSGYDVSDAYSGNQETFGGYNLVGNCTGPTQVDTVTISGSSGDCTITAGGITNTVAYDTSVAKTITDFVTAFATDYAAVGIILTYSATTLVFTGTVAGKGFTTTSADGTTDLSGAVVHTTPINTAQVDTVTLTGTTGTANVTGVGGLTKLATFNDSLTQTATDFVTLWAAAYLVEGVVLTSSTTTLIFTANVAGTPHAAPVVTNVTLTLAGTNVATTPNVAAGWVGRIWGWALDAAAAAGTIIRVLIKD